MSIRETILAAIQTQLASVAGVQVSRSRREQITDLPAVIVRPESEEDPGDLLGVSDTVLTVALDIYGRGEIPDQATDATLSAVYLALSTDPTLGLGSDVQILPGRSVQWSTDAFDDSLVTLTLRITYRAYQGAL